MESKLLSSLGKIAGIGGIALGVFLLIFQGVLQKNFLPQLKPEQALPVILSLLLLTFSIAGIGIIGWLISRAVKPDTPVPQAALLILAALIAADLVAVVYIAKPSVAPAVVLSGPADANPVAKAAPKMPDQSDNMSTYHMVRHIRCETGDSIRQVLLKWLRSLASGSTAQAGDPIAQKLVAQYDSDPGSIVTFNSNLFKGPSYLAVRQFENLFLGTGVAYAFDSNPQFTQTDTFGGLLTMFAASVGGVNYCDGFVATGNDTGRIGVHKLITDFIEVSVFSNGTSPMVKAFTYRPSATSTDTRAVIIALALPPTSNVGRPPGPSPVAAGKQVTVSELLALTAIDQFKARPAQ
jgi:hypothetical protein